MKATLTRFYHTGQTLGKLIVWNQDPVPTKVLELCTIELPWLDNKRRISCIPEGRYKVVFRPVGNAFRYPHFHLPEVPNRDWILIHRGNTVRNTAGCILVGTRFQYIDADRKMDIVGSTKALDEMVKLLSGSGFELTIVS